MVSGALAPPLSGRRRAFAAAVVLLMAQGCSGSEPRREQFVGKWKSSRMATAPLYLNDNGEWEIKNSEDRVMQYGLWQLEGKRIVWNIKMDGRLVRDVNAIVSAGGDRFELREQDGSVTLFERMK